MVRVAMTMRESANVHGARIDCLETTYVKYFTSAAATVLLVPNGLPDPGRWLAQVCPDAVVLTGGDDIRTGAEAGNRERTEGALLAWAIHRKIPVLGICRGMQFIQTYFGGNLAQSLWSAVGHSRPGNTHRLVVKLPGDELDFEHCNSFHDHGVLREHLAKGLRSFAMCDHVVEGLFHERLPVVGVQWHPERDNAPIALDRLLIDSFLQRRLFWSVA
jgi:gamma-glutamyl-gamma-aminobutyrate hydrolase PuuD